MSRRAVVIIPIIPSKVNSLRNYRRQVSKEINIKRKARSDEEKEKRKKKKGKEEERESDDGEKVGSRSCSRFDRDADLIEPGRKINNGPFCFPRGTEEATVCKIIPINGDQWGFSLGMGARAITLVRASDAEPI